MRPASRPLTLHRLKVPLREPYHLSFGPVLWFDTLLVEVADAEGGPAFGEATVLTGYTEETIDDAWATAQLFAARLAREPGNARELVRQLAATHPFTATAFGTAFDMLAHHPLLAPRRAVRVPIVGLLHARDEAAMERAIDELAASGYRTLKLKVGFEVDEDIAFVRAAQRLSRGRVQLRIDANQGYDVSSARRFVTAVTPEHIELFEQPCAAGDWDAHMAVAAVSQLPLMLDESIYGVADIERAAESKAAAFIKVKLMKLATLDRLAAAIARIRELGMQPVLGNGVACDVGCWMEACVAAELIDNAGEMNGYLKACGTLLREPPAYRDGAIELAADYRPALDREAVDRYTVARWQGTASLTRRLAEENTP